MSDMRVAMSELPSETELLWRRNNLLQNEVETLRKRVDELLADNNVQLERRRELERAPGAYKAELSHERIYREGLEARYNELANLVESVQRENAALRAQINKARRIADELQQGLKASVEVRKCS